MFYVYITLSWPNVIVMWLDFLLYNLQVPSLNLSLASGYPDRLCVVFLSISGKISE
jgi:hypothetical protein